jgi:phage repressor protein C with HTH and peptisase S24 domain
VSSISRKHQTTPEPADEDAGAPAAFIQRLQKLVAERGASLTLAEAIGVPNNTLHSWLSGSQPGRDKLLQVARATGVSISWLVAGEGEMRPNRPPGYQLPLWPEHRGPGASRRGELPPLAFSERLWNRVLELSHGETPALVEVEDDTMSPTLQPNDLALVQISMAPMVSGIWYLVGIGFRRLQLLPGEPGKPAGAILSCDNPKYGSETQTLKARDLVKLMNPGRLIWRAGII